MLLYHPLFYFIPLIYLSINEIPSFRTDNDESDEYCPYCDNHYVLPAKEPESDAINLSELLQQQLMQFNDPRMKSKFIDVDEEFEALLQE